MSQQLGRVVSEILNRYFGEIVQKVGNDLLTYGSKPIVMIVKTTGLSRTQVIESLRTLLKFDLATFEPSHNEVGVDYKLNPENVLLFIRYPRFLVEIKSRHGSAAELLVEEMMQRGTETATALIVASAAKCTDDKEQSVSVVHLRDTFTSLATAGYLQQAPVAELSEGSEAPAMVPTMVPVATIVPEIDLRVLVHALANGMADVTDKVYWKLNFERFNQDYRDELMVKAITRRIDENAGEIMRMLLEQMYLTSSAWARHSNPAPWSALAERTQRPLLARHLAHYLTVLEENGAGFVRRTGDEGGGQWVVRAQHAAAQLAGCAVLQAVSGRLGPHAHRILRLIQSKKYISEEDIQKRAMLPNKQCKELTYRLLEQHFISVQPMRKAAAGGMLKAVYLYHMNFHEVCVTVQELCYRSLHNVLKRSAHERRVHARLRDKQRRVRTLVHGMRSRNEPQDNIDDVEGTLTPPERTALLAIDKRLKMLGAAELELDRTLFVLQWYLTYPHNEHSS